LISSKLKIKNHQGVHRSYRLDGVTDLLFDRKFLNTLGITRLAVTDGLDKIGIPTASATSPDSSDTISIYSGKGLTKTASKISAVMEAIERTSATHRPENIIESTETELKSSRIPFTPCESYTELKYEEYDENKIIEWVEGFDLVSKTKITVPLNMVISPYIPCNVNIFKPFRVTHTNGLSSGFSLEEAIPQAICEIVERDAVSLAELRASIFPYETIKKITDYLGEEYKENTAENFADDYETYKSIDKQTLPDVCKELLAKFETAGLDVTVKYIPTDIGIVTFGCVCFEKMPNGKAMFRAGYGTHPDATTALIRALTELAQSRIVDIQGGREDLHTLDKRRTKDEIPKHWLYTDSTDSLSFSSLKSYNFEDLLDEINFLLDCLCRVGLKQVIVVPLKSIYDKSVVIRVIIPGIETWHPTGGYSRLGVRAQKFANEKGILLDENS
jgi:thioglycine synthase